MNAWYRFSLVAFAILAAATLFLTGAWAGSMIAINWRLFAIIAISAIISLTAVWLIGNRSK